MQAISGAGISFDVDGMGHALGDAIARDIQAHPHNPMKAPPFSLPGHLNEALNGAPATVFADVIANAAWGDQREANRLRS